MSLDACLGVALSKIHAAELTQHASWIQDLDVK